MPRAVPQSFCVFLLVLIYSASFNFLVGQEKDFSFSHDNVLGTSLDLQIGCESADQASKLEAELLAEIDRLNLIFSEYKRESEFSKLLGAINKPTPVSDELFECLVEANKYQSLTQNGFHPGAGVFAQQWKEGEKVGMVPYNSHRVAALKLLAKPIWSLDKANKTVTLLVDGPVSLNAIAKGYIIETAGAKLMKTKVPPAQLTINIGGDLRTWGDAKTKFGIADPSSAADNSKPFQTIEISNRAIATSGNYQRKFKIGGKSYSHIIDPRSGLPVSGISSASVVASNATMADALATAFSVLKAEESLAIVDTLTDCECLIIDEGGKSFSSKGWDALVVGSPVAGDAVAENELVIDFNIRRYGGGRYRRPYVAVWIETSDGIPVRTLALWLMEKRPGPRWHRDLSRWYNGEQMRLLVEDKELIGTISQATRPPGKYKVVWDGKGDNGKRVVAGKYVVYIEAAREHGTYKLMKHEFEHGTELFSAELKDNAEIESAALKYRKSKK